MVPRFRLSRYTQETDLDAEDIFIHLDGVKTFERLTARAQFDYERQGTATTELTDTGRIGVNIDRTTIDFSGSLEYALNERLTLNAFGGLSDISFEELTGSTFSDYDLANAGTGIRYASSAATSILFNVSVSTFSVPSARSETVSYTYRGGLDHRFNETTSMVFQVGQNISRLKSQSDVPVLISLVPFLTATQRVTETSSGSGHVLDLIVEKEFERGGVTVTWNRYFSPSSQGSRQKRQAVEGLIEYRVTDGLTAETIVTYREQEREGQFSTPLNALETLSVLGRGKYRLTPTLDIEVTYRFREQSDPTTSLGANWHEGSIGLRFRGDPIRYIR